MNIREVMEAAAEYLSQAAMLIDGGVAVNADGARHHAARLRTALAQVGEPGAWECVSCGFKVYQCGCDAIKRPLYATPPATVTDDEVKRLQERIEYERDPKVRFDVENPCGKCGGMGRYGYPNTATYHRGRISGQGFTDDICDGCWGSGDSTRPFRNLLAATVTEGEREAIADAVGPIYLGFDPDDSRRGEVKTLAERIRRGDFAPGKERP